MDVYRRQRLYRLAELVWPDPAPDGAARLARDGDARLTAGWFAAFADEVDDMGKGEDQSAAAREKISHGGVTVWEAGGEPVAIACNTMPVHGMVRIGPVYTPPERRGRGYASAATAALSQRLLEAGAEEVRPVHRPRQSGVQLDLPAHRLPVGRRPGGAGVFGRLATDR